MHLVPSGPNFGRYKGAVLIKMKSGMIPREENEETREMKNAIRLALEENIRKKQEWDQQDTDTKMRLVTSRLSTSSFSSTPSSPTTTTTTTTMAVDTGYSSPPPSVIQSEQSTPMTPVAIGDGGDGDDDDDDKEEEEEEEEDEKEIEGSDYHARFNAALDDLIELAPDTSEERRREIGRASCRERV